MEAVDNIVHDIPESAAFDPLTANKVGVVHEKPYFNVNKLTEEEAEEVEVEKTESEAEECVQVEATPLEEGVEENTTEIATENMAESEAQQVI